MNNIEKMVISILDNPKLCVRTSISNDLASAVYTQDCPELLIPLLESQNDEILHACIWIASELGQKSYSLLPYIVELLIHNDSFIRYYALDCIHASYQKIQFETNDLHELIMNKVSFCLNDLDESVREKAECVITALMGSKNE